MTMRYVTLIVGFVCLGAPLVAQKEKREPLTPVQVDQIRDLGGFPDERVKLYTKFLDERADTIKGLTDRKKSPARASRLDGELQNLTALLDEVGENLDVYSDRHSDIRKSLKALSDAAPRWLRTLRALAGEPTFDESRKEAIESGEELADQAARLLAEQEEYFRLHKNLAGQERDEPK
jgi:hypothetical protein